MSFLTILLLIGLFFLIIIIVSITLNIKYKNKSKEVFDSISDFDATEKYISSTFGISVGYDKNRNKICFVYKGNVKQYTFKDIIQSELDIDGDIVLKQSITDTVGRSIVGGVLGGGVGAIIGGVSSSKKGQNKIKNIELKITVNDTDYPIYRINFLNIETIKESQAYKINFSEAEKWHGIITTLIKKVELNESNNTKLNPSNSNSRADELIKLKSLLDMDVISKKEFEIEKSRILKSN